VSIFFLDPALSPLCIGNSTIKPPVYHSTYPRILRGKGESVGYISGPLAALLELTERHPNGNGKTGSRVFQYLLKKRRRLRFSKWKG